MAEAPEGAASADGSVAVRAATKGGRINVAVSILLGQVISLFITGTAVFASQLAGDGINIPTVQSGLNYVLLCLHFLFASVFDCEGRSGSRRKRPELPAWRYALWAFCDFEANCLAVLAYQYTSVASVMLLDCFAIPCAMFVSHLLLGARYRWGHVFGCAVCIAGLSMTVRSDVLSGQAVSAPNGPAWFGDLLILAAATLYGFSNVQQELLLKSGIAKRTQALGKLGMWGSLFACIQVFLFERDALASCTWTPHTLLCLLGFQVCLFCMYVLTSIFLQRCDSALFNLSMLTSDVYSAVFAWRVMHQRFQLYYASAFATTLSGVVIYLVQPDVLEGAAKERASCGSRAALLAPGSQGETV